MRIMVSGPYTSGGADKATRKARLEVMNRAALAVFERGHIPVTGVNMALPVIEAAGPKNFDKLFDRIMMPLSLALAETCDSCLRIGGASEGADQEAESFRQRGLPVYQNLEDIPDET